MPAIPALRKLSIVTSSRPAWTTKILSQKKPDLKVNKLRALIATRLASMLNLPKSVGTDRTLRWTTEVKRHSQKHPPVGDPKGTALRESLSPKAQH